jgi:hypothetical protein
MKPSKALQIGLCRSAGGLLFTPDTDIIKISTINVARLTLFVVVLREWIDFKNRLVITPTTMQIKIGEKVQNSFPSKNLFNIGADDYQYFASSRTDMLANRHRWQEYSFNTCIGPNMTLAESVSIRDVMNSIFVDQMLHLKERCKNASK